MSFSGDLAVSGRLRRIRSSRPFRRINRKGLNLKINAGNFRSAYLRAESSALAKLCEPKMPGTAEVKTHCNQDAIDIHARLPFKFKKHAYGSGVIGAAAQHPTAATENGPGQGLHQSPRLLHRDCSHLYRPGNRGFMCPIAEWNVLSHIPVIGAMRRNIMHLQELDDA